LIHAGIKTQTKITLHYVDSETLEKQGTDLLANADAILVPGGFGSRGIEGKILAAQYARTHRIPYLGICLGMQVAIIEFARHQALLKDAHSSEFNADTPHPVIALITEWLTAEGQIEKRTAHSDLGGTMRLGAQVCHLEKDSQAYQAYGSTPITERHRHRYEVNNHYLETLKNAGLKFSGRSADGLVEMIELPNHPWFVACQFHPEFTSNPRDSHPLFIAFVKAAIKK